MQLGLELVALAEALKKYKERQERSAAQKRSAMELGHRTPERDSSLRFVRGDERRHNVIAERYAAIETELTLGGDSGSEYVRVTDAARQFASEANDQNFNRQLQLYRDEVRQFNFDPILTQFSLD